MASVLIRAQLPDEVVSTLRATFHDVEIVTAGDNPDIGDPERFTGYVHWSISPEELDRLSNLQWIQSVSAGVDQFPFATLKRRGIVLTNNRGVHAPNIAEHIFAMMLALSRKIPQLVRAQDQELWLSDPIHQIVTEINGQRMLVVGYGNIGRAVAERAHAFGMSVSVVRRKNVPVESWIARSWSDAELPLAVAEADQIVLALPNTDESRGLFDAELLAACKPGACIYNVGRGGAIDTNALVDHLQTGHLSGAGLDVTDPEPLPAGHPLWSMENVLITSHTAGATPAYWSRALPILSANVERLLSGKRPMVNEVDFEAGY